jgi:hypothetical protein
MDGSLLYVHHHASVARSRETLAFKNFDLCDLGLATLFSRSLIGEVYDAQNQRRLHWFGKLEHCLLNCGCLPTV